MMGSSLPPWSGHSIVVEHKMKRNESLKRFIALTLSIAAIVSCDSRLPTESTISGGGSLVDDVVRPTVKFSLSAGTNNTVDVGAPVSVTVTASDDKGVASVTTTIRNGALVLGGDTVTMKPAALTTTRVIPLSLVGVVNGDHVTIRTTVTDVGQNTRIDSLVIAIADTIGPVTTVNSTSAGKALKGGDSLDVRLTASDSSGVRYVGYRLLLPRASDSLVIKADSTFVPAGTSPRIFGPVSFKLGLADTLPVANYVISGFARDASGLKGTGASPVSFSIVDLKKPTLTFVTPIIGGKVNVGDSVLVTAKLHDNVGLQSVTLSGVSARGNPGLGTADTVLRYQPVIAPGGVGFPKGLRDTTIKRYLKIASPLDTLTDSLIVVGITTDASNNADTSRIKIRLVSGPNVIFISPIAGDSATRGAGFTVSLRATSAVGVSTLGFRVQGDVNWPTPLDTTVVTSYGTPSKDVTFAATILIPANATAKSQIIITPISVDANGQEGSSAPGFISVRAGLPPGPKVLQSIQSRVERFDSVTVTGLGNGITIVGFELRDQAGLLIKRDSVAIAAPFPSTAVVSVPLNLPTSTQGKRVSLTSFAYDLGGRVGYSVRSTASASISSPAGALIDTALVVYGQTFALPTSRNGTIADLQVDASRGNIFLSNISFGRLEVFQAGIGFDPTGVVVGSQPWGMTMSRTAPLKDTLYVANSGGTNLSRVFIGGTNPAAMKEDLVNRLVTRASYLFKLTEVTDASTGKIRLTTSLPILFSDRPQYVEQAASGRLYVTTKPTIQAPSGTVRYMDPAAPAPDERFILDFAFAGSDPNSWVVANLDGVGVIPAPATSSANDQLTLCDHASGSLAPPTCVTTTGGILATINALKAAVPTTDVEYAINIDFNSLGMTDTTFVAASGDGQWITFGEGHKSPVARNFILKDDGTVPNRFTYASGSLNVVDLMNNSSDQIFGLALDKTGETIGVHGTETSFSAVTIPFTQRLQGKKTTFSQGTGIAFHPNADGPNTPQASRLAFVASANGSIEAVDIAYYDYTRGSLATKFNLYGPLRASLPFPGDDPSVVFKLFGLSPKGLVVVDVTAADLLPGP
ncbi:MAG: hypothetical protein JWM95_3435 [Gemmatimonadetes bacterium]|nr:hypothetical protein [Gemmatimonadota bacterium]